LVVRSKYATASEFWDMMPGQVWWLIEDMMPETIHSKPKELAELRDMVKRSKARDSKESEAV